MCPNGYKLCERDGGTENAGVIESMITQTPLGQLKRFITVFAVGDIASLRQRLRQKRSSSAGRHELEAHVIAEAVADRNGLRFTNYTNRRRTYRPSHRSVKSLCWGDSFTDVCWAGVVAGLTGTVKPGRN